MYTATRRTCLILKRFRGGIAIITVENVANVMIIGYRKGLSNSQNLGKMHGKRGLTSIEHFTVRRNVNYLNHIKWLLLGWFMTSA